MSIKTNQLVRALSIALSALSCVCTFMILPMYILGATSEQKNLPHLIWPPFLSLPSILTIMLCCICVRSTYAHAESFMWQFVYGGFFVFCVGIIELHYDSKGEADVVKAVFYILAFIFGIALLMMDVNSIRNRHSLAEDRKLNLNVWRILSYPFFFFLLGSSASVIPGMRELIKDADIGKEMIALLVISCPLEILNVFWDSIKKDDKAETEIRLNDLCSKVQDACTLASSLQESQNRIEEKVHGIDERLSRRVDDKSGISFLKSNSAYELKITMCRHRR